jgi:hypothetical protein
MPNPYGIEQVDVPGMLMAYRTARQDRANDLMQGMRMRQLEAGLNHTQMVLNISRQFADRFRGGGGGGPPAPVAAYDASPTGSASDSIGSAYSAPPLSPSSDAPSAAPIKADLAPTSSASPLGAPTFAPGHPSAPGHSSLLTRPRSFLNDNSDLLAQLSVIEPEHAKGVVDAFGTMDKAKLEASSARNSAIGLAAEQLLHVPAEQRAQVLRDEIGPDLLRHGVSQGMIADAAADLSDAKLTSYVQQTRDIEKVIEAHRLDRNTDSEIAYRKDEIGVRRDANAITERNNIRTNSTSAENNIRSTDTSRANNTATNATSAANNLRTTDTSAANNVRSTTTSASNAQIRGRRGRAGGGGAPPIAVMPNGQKMTVRNGQWVPM